MTYDVQSIEVGAGDTALVEEVLRAISRYCEANDIVPCPVELRDTMLALAALTHIEAAKMKCNEVDVTADGFAEAASDRFTTSPALCRCRFSAIASGKRARSIDPASVERFTAD